MRFLARHLCLLVVFCLSFPLASLLCASEPVALFNGKDLKDWEWHDAGGSGPVEVKNGEMHIQSGDSISGVIYTQAEKLSWKHYEITLEAKRTDGFDFFCGLTFPVGDLKTCATLVMGGWGGSVTGISSLNGMDAAENSTGHFRPYKDQTWYRVKLRVSPKYIQVWIDDEEALITDVEGQKIEVRPGPIEEFQPLSITTYATSSAIRNLRYKNLETPKP